MWAILVCLTGKELPGRTPGIRTISVKDGLPQSQVICLKQDQFGYLWIGTLDGLARYDGKEFQRFSQLHGLCSNEVFSIEIDAENNVWVATSGGVAVLAASGMFSSEPKFRCLIGEDGFPPEGTQGCTFSAVGDLWIAARQGPLRIRKENLAKVIRGETGLMEGFPERTIAKTRLWMLAADKFGHVFFAGDYRLWEYTGGKFEVVDLPFAGQPKLLDGMGTFADGTCWLVISGQIYLRKEEGWMEFDWKSSGNPWKPEFGEVMVAHQGKQGDVWLGGQSRLEHWNSGQVEYYSAADGLSRYNIQSLLEDREGTLWVGANGGSLQRIGDESYTNFDRFGELGVESVRSVLRDRDGRLLVATLGGLYQMEGEQLKKIPEVDFPVRTMLYDHAGRLWLVGRDRVVYLRDGQMTTVMEERGGEFNVFVISQSPDGKIWFGKGQRLICWKEGELHKYAVPVREVGLIRAIHFTSDGQCYVGGSGIDLHRIEFDSVSGDIVSMDRLPVPPQFNGKEARTIAEEDDGTIWIGYQGAGLLRLMGNKVLPLNEKDGLPTSNIFELVWDRQGFLWAGTGRGLVRIDAHAYRESGIVDLQLVEPSMRIGGVEFNTGAGWLDADGTLWMGNVGGLFRYEPQANPSAQKAAQVAILGMQPGVADTLLGDGAVIPDDAPYFRIYFKAVSLSNPDMVRYRHRISELDTTWSDPVSLEYATFSGLAPGRYTFEVMACNPSGTWNPDFRSIEFEVAGTVSMVKWGLGLALLLLGAMIWVWRRTVLEKNKLKAQLDDVDEYRSRAAQPETPIKSEPPNATAETLFFVKVRNKMVRLDSRECFFLKGAGDYVEIQQADKKYLVRSTLTGSLTWLPDAAAYLRVHRSWIVRIDKIDAVRDDQIEIGAHRIPIGDSYRENLREALKFLS